MEDLIGEEDDDNFDHLEQYEETQQSREKERIGTLAD